MLYSVLSKHGSTVATADSITPTYGIPTTILWCKPWTKYLILEMGVEYPGDAKFYLWLAKPDIAVMTMIDIEHTHFFGNLESVAREENQLLNGRWITVTN